MKACYGGDGPPRRSFARRSKAAFTLIEILVVVVILALLAALLLPVFSNARERGRAATCQSNLKQIGAALELYASDYREKYPPYDIGSCSWQDSLISYVKDSEIYNCPSMPQAYFRSGCMLSEPSADEDLSLNHGGYLMNHPFALQSKGISRPSILQPARFIFVLDGLFPTGFMTPPPPPSINMTEESLRLFGVKFRHQNRANMLFGDGHVKALNLSQMMENELWSLTGHN